MPSPTALSRDGLFAFSVERHDGPEDFVLQTIAPLRASETYLSQAASTSGLSLSSLASEIIRQDRGAGIEGLMVVARKDGV